ncbi:MAG TPA: S1C family serine protease, partial [Candidatus Polarisedimenticolia bacterium]|nr:S1C family serine protease [Candidatus Polarisedimenticolia bacterium]
LLPARSGPGSTADSTIPPAVAAALSSVVGVGVREVEKVPIFHNGRFRNEEVEGLGAGSGVVISEEGLILTNAHVVAGAREVHVRLLTGREIDAAVVSVDEASDLALLRAPGIGLPAIPFSDEPLPPSGSVAFVLGNRADRGTEVAPGRIGPHRHVRAGARPIEFWCEVEAPVGPGDSGGALLDSAGRLLGIPSLLVSYASEGSHPTPSPVGLFIPAAHARRALRLMLSTPALPWPFIGLLLDDPLLASGSGPPREDDTAVRVRRVMPGSPAAAAGLQVGDRITAIGERPVGDRFEALDAVLDLEPGRSVSLRFERDGRPATITLKPGRRPADPRPDGPDDFALHTGLNLDSRPGEPGRRDAAPLAFARMTPRARSEMPLLEAALFDAGPSLEAILPGRDALEGRAKHLPIFTAEDLSAILPRCFVKEQFVALVHWDLGGRQTLDRAYVHRKIYPVVL